MVDAFTSEEKVRIRAHMGYLNVSESATFGLGFPAAVQTQFIIETAMNKMLQEAIPLVRKYLAVLDAIESQMVGDMELLAIISIDEIEIRPKEMNDLRREYLHWRATMANAFGVQPNPYDQRFSGYGGGGAGPNLNVPVIH